jgi:hypothetical protein
MIPRAASSRTCRRSRRRRRWQFRIECDIQLPDGEAMVHHDDALGRSPRAPARLLGKTAAELKAIVQEYAGAGMMTLGDLCASRRRPRAAGSRSRAISMATAGW